MDNDLRERFDEAESELTFGEGSLDAVKARARQRTHQSRFASGAVALLLVAGLGFVFFGQLNLRDQVDTLDVTDTTGVDENGEGSDVVSAGLIEAADFTYVGSFAPPEVANGADSAGFGFGGDAIAFNPANNSLFITGFRINPEVAEISIPEVSPHGGLRTDLVEAELLQSFGDITGGLGEALIGSEDVGGQNDFRINGLEVVEGQEGLRLAWTATQYQNAAADELPGHGHSSLDLANPDVEGPWRMQDFAAEQTAGYVFEVPQTFADSFFDGRRLMSGYLAEVRGFTSQGAPFFAFDAPDSGEPEERLEALELANYEFPDNEVSGFSNTMSTSGADWVTTVDGRSAILTVGNSMPIDNDELCSFANETNVSAHSPQISLYDPADLAAVAAGDAQPYEVEPYLVVSLNDNMIPVCGAQVAGVAFDAETNRLFVVQKNVTAVADDFDARPAIHVFVIG